MRVLLITDQPLIELALTQLLHQHHPGIEVHCRHQTPEGLRAVRNDGPWTLILADLDTKRARIGHMTHKIKMLQPSIKLATITGTPSAAEAKEQVRLGVSLYLQKTLPVEALAAAVGTLLSPMPTTQRVSEPKRRPRGKGSGSQGEHGESALRSTPAGGTRSSPSRRAGSVAQRPARKPLAQPRAQTHPSAMA